MTKPALPRENKAHGPLRLLYLDYDGVLHPSDVWYLGEGAPQLGESSRGHQLFEHADLLASALRPFPDVSLVLSTSWVLVYGFTAAVARLPPELQSRVIGASFDPERDGPGFAAMARGYQLLHDAHRRGSVQWLALDDDGMDWPEEERHRLVLTDPLDGIAAPGVLNRLARKLASL